MTVQKDWQEVAATAKGTYATFEQCTEDQTAKQMSQYMDRYINQINSQLNVTAQNQ